MDIPPLAVNGLPAPLQAAIGLASFLHSDGVGRASSRPAGSSIAR
jgi:hypothetical protein